MLNNDNDDDGTKIPTQKPLSIFINSGEINQLSV